jgi:hypothetical protein
VMYSKTKQDMGRAFIDLTPELLCDLLKVKPSGELRGTVDSPVIINATNDPLPQDAKGLRCGITSCGNIRLVIESVHLSDVSEGGKIVELSPTYSIRRLKHGDRIEA